MPNTLQEEHSQITPIPACVIPDTEEASHVYREQGGNLTEFGLFGSDPLKDRVDLMQRRETHFLSTHLPFKELFSDIVSGTGSHFQTAIIDFVGITNSLKHFL